MQNAQVNEVRPLPKVLMVGMPNLENQFARAVKKYGCEVVHAHADPGGKIDTSADIAIICVGNCSSGKIIQVKDAFKDLKKPTLTVRSGFTEIKEHFEVLIKTYQEGNTITPQTAFRGPESKMSDTSPLSVVAAKLVEDLGEKQGLRHDVERAKQIVEECQAAGMSAADTVEMLLSEGVGKKGNEPYTTFDVYNMRQRNKKDAEKEPPKMQETATAEKHDAVNPATQLELIGEVMGSTLPGDEKLRIIRDIQTGKVTQREYQVAKIGKLPDNRKVFVVKSGSILDVEERTLIQLTKDQAKLVLKFHDRIKGFVENN